MSASLLAGCGDGESDGGAGAGRGKGAGASEKEPAKTRKQALAEVRAAVGLVADEVRVMPTPKGYQPCYVNVVGYTAKPAERSDVQRAVDRLERDGWAGEVETMASEGPEGPAYYLRFKAGKWEISGGSGPVPQEAKSKLPGYDGTVFLSGYAESCDLFTRKPESSPSAGPTPE